MICVETSSRMHFVWNLDIGEADICAYDGHPSLP